MVGNRIYDGANPVHLHGVNYSGTEYACVQGWGIFDGPNNQAMVNALKSWKINVVKVPLNETCWLGINGVNAAYSGAVYRNAVVSFVNLLIQNGIYVEILDMWVAPGGYPATYQAGAPTADHSPAMWASMAQTFKNHTKVILAPYGETHVGWACFMHTPSLSCGNTYGPNNQPYLPATMKQAIEIFRQNGYNGVVAIPCIAWANLCGRQWDSASTYLQSYPEDPLEPDQVVAEVHTYTTNVCNSVSCWDHPVDGYKPILDAGVPLIIGEAGDEAGGSSWISGYLNWADSVGASYVLWTWNTWNTPMSLISDFAGTPRGAYGNYIRNRFVSNFP